jgi:hypothetical protein
MGTARRCRYHSIIMLMYNIFNHMQHILYRCLPATIHIIVSTSVLQRYNILTISVAAECRRYITRIIYYMLQCVHTIQVKQAPHVYLTTYVLTAYIVQQFSGAEHRVQIGRPHYTTKPDIQLFSGYGFFG